MKSVLLLLAGFLLSSCSPSTEPQRECSKQTESGWESAECSEVDAKPSESSLTPTPADGAYKVLYDDGTIKENGTRKGGRIHGLVELFHENGELKARGIRQWGVQDGSWEFFDKRGNLFRTETYKVGELHGLSEVFSEHGNLAKTETYEGGKLHGHVETFTDDGKLTTTERYIDGELVRSIKGKTYDELILENDQTISLELLSLETDPDYIHFNYDLPIRGIEISGFFKPMEWACLGLFKGETVVRVTRATDDKSFEFYLDQVTFVSDNVCSLLFKKDNGSWCNTENHLSLVYAADVEETLKSEDQYNITTTQPIQIADIDFDGSDELIVFRGCGVRSHYEYEAYDFANTPNTFDIDRTQLTPSEQPNDRAYGPRNRSFYFHDGALFDRTTETVNMSLSGGACIFENNTYKSGADGFKLWKQTTAEDVTGVCTKKHYEALSEGDLQLTGTECAKWVSSNWVSMQCPNEQIDE